MASGVWCFGVRGVLWLQSGQMKTAIIIVDHGSRLAESNQLTEQVVAKFGERFADEFAIVEPAHMDITEPSIATAYKKCVDRGAQRIVICPYFLGPGKHWTRDIPRLATEAQKQHLQTTYHITAILGLDDLMLELLHKRITQCRVCDYCCNQCSQNQRCGPAARESSSTPAII